MDSRGRKGWCALVVQSDGAWRPARCCAATMARRHMVVVVCGDLMIVKVWVRASTPRSTPPRDVTDRERSIVSVDVCTDVGKHLESTVLEKPPLHDIFPSHDMIRRHLI